MKKHRLVVDKVSISNIITFAGVCEKESDRWRWIEPKRSVKTISQDYEGTFIINKYKNTDARLYQDARSQVEL